MSHSADLSGVLFRNFSRFSPEERLPVINGQIQPQRIHTEQSIKVIGTDCKVSSVVLGLIMTILAAGGGALIFISGGPTNLVPFACGVALGTAGLGFGIWIAIVVIRTRNHIHNLNSAYVDVLNSRIAYRGLLDAMEEREATSAQVKAAINVLDQEEFNLFINVVDQEYCSLLSREQDLLNRTQTSNREQQAALRREQTQLRGQREQLEKILEALIFFPHKLAEISDGYVSLGLYERLERLTLESFYSRVAHPELSLEDISSEVDLMGDERFVSLIEFLEEKASSREGIEVNVLKAVADADRLAARDGLSISSSLAKGILMALDPDQDSMQAALRRFFERVGPPSITTNAAYARHPKFLASIMSGEERFGDDEVRRVYAMMDELQRTEYFRALAASTNLDGVAQVIEHFFVAVFESRQTQPTLLRAMSKLPAYLAKMHLHNFDSPAAAPMIQAAWDAVEARGDVAKQIYINYIFQRLTNSSSVYGGMITNFGDHAIPDATLTIMAKMPLELVNVFKSQRLSEEPPLVSQVLAKMNPEELTGFIKQEARLNPEKALLRARHLWTTDPSFDLSSLISQLVEDSNLERVFQRYDMSQDEQYANFILALLERVTDARLPQLDQSGRTNYVALLRILVREAGENIDPERTLVNGEFTPQRLSTQRLQLMQAFRTDHQFKRLQSSDYIGVDEAHKQKFLACTDAAAQRS